MNISIIDIIFIFVAIYIQYSISSLGNTIRGREQEVIIDYTDDIINRVKALELENKIILLEYNSLIVKIDSLYKINNTLQPKNNK